MLGTLETTRSSTLVNKGVSNTNTGKTSAPREDDALPTCIIITYSGSADLKNTLYALHGNTARASVHYLIDKEIDDDTMIAKQYQEHNDLTQQAFYAGKSYWKSETGVNKFGIGIMLINDAKSEFSPEQIGQLKSLLDDIHSRYPKLDITTDIVGLGEVAARHIAPGKYFPWKDLANSGFGQWIETSEQQKSVILIPPQGEEVDVSDVQQKLQDHGYGIEVTGEWDIETALWFAKFNIRYDTSYIGTNDLSDETKDLLTVCEEDNLGRQTSMRENLDNHYVEPKDLVWTDASNYVLDNLHNSIENLDSQLAGDNVQSTTELHGCISST